MIIKDMFINDIERKINGVVKVTQDEESVVEQEIREYVVTKELKKHFIAFFNGYAESFDAPTADIGVWISGFFGSGKSHFLKALSYILANREIDGVKTAERFREKILSDVDDPQALIAFDKATKTPAETILFNIDIESPLAKSKGAAVRVFAKMFYDRLGFCGDDLKVALLEQHLQQEGKLEEFCRTFEEKRGKSWKSQRKALAFNRGYVDATLAEVLNMSEKDVENWLQEGVEANYSIADFVRDVKRHVDSKPQDFRLLFMIDEVGQFVGENTGLLLNLQSIVEELGAKCGGKVWIVCTGQEAVDELLIKMRVNEFSRIRARFKTNLSLSSSSVDEVIQKRVLDKKPNVAKKLEALFKKNESALHNLFVFTSDTRGDIKGFANAEEFRKCFPFVPYQFYLAQSAFKGIREHGFSGKHMSVGERSMLSGFQDAAKSIKEKDEYALAPFYRFYDSVQASLDSSVRFVIDRCQQAAEKKEKLELFDVDVLKLLYLIRYAEDDIKANVQNITVLMVDSIQTNKTELRNKIEASLERLRTQNYVDRSGDLYNFLTNEERDVQKEINAVEVEDSEMLRSVASVLFDEIYQTKKHRFGNNDFPFERRVNSYRYGAVYDETKLVFAIPDLDLSYKEPITLTLESMRAALFVLENLSFYDKLTRAEKIKKYADHRAGSASPTKREIIQFRLKDADALREEAIEDLEEAICNAVLYVQGSRVELKGRGAKARIDGALNCLVSSIYHKFELAKSHVESDEQIRQILTEKKLIDLDPNQGAVDAVEEFLKLQFGLGKKTSMADVQRRFQGAPYGWREIDVAAFVARLLHDQKIVVKRFEENVLANDKETPTWLRKATEIGKTIVEIRRRASEAKIQKAIDVLKEYFDDVDVIVPKDEDKLREFIEKSFKGQKERREKRLSEYVFRRYPGKERLERSRELVDDILKFRNDPIALISAVVEKEDELLDAKEATLDVEEFFKNKRQIFDDAVDTLERFDGEIKNGCYANEEKAKSAIQTLRAYLNVDENFRYRDVPKYAGLLATIRDAHNRAILAKRDELSDALRQCEEAVRQTCEKAEVDASDLFEEAKKTFKRRLELIEEEDDLVKLGGLWQDTIKAKDYYCRQAEERKKEPEEKTPTKTIKPKKNYSVRDRQIIFKAKILKSEADVEEYLQEAREVLIEALKNCDGVELK